MSKQFDLLNTYYSGKATDAEKQQLMKELEKADASNSDFDQVWNHSFGEMPRNIDKRLKKQLRKATHKPSERKVLLMNVAIRAAACAVILLSVGFGAYFKYQNDLLTRYANMTVEVGSGQKATAYLPDGTKVTLNSCSKLSYGKNFDGHQRLVKLTGEAFFNVAKDKSAPFIVEANKVQVRATGTAFNVKAYPDGDAITTYLTEGSVVVSNDNQRVDLAPGEVASYSLYNSNLQKLVPSNRSLYTAWLSDEMMFDNEPLSEILKQLERNYNIRFDVKFRDLNKITFTGTLKNSSLQSTLEALNFTSKINYRNRNGVIELSR